MTAPPVSGGFETQYAGDCFSSISHAEIDPLFKGGAATRENPANSGNEPAPFPNYKIPTTLQNEAACATAISALNAAKNPY